MHTHAWHGGVVRTFVTLSVASSSLSYFPPILSPAVAFAPFLKCGGTYPPDPAPRPPVLSTSPASPAPSSPAAPPSPMGAIVSLNGHRAVKCSPSQILHLTFMFFNFSFGSSFLFCSSLSSFFQVMLGLNMMFSPTEVVSKDGPGGWPFSLPNLDHARRSATRGLTFSLTMVVRMRRVVFTLLPSSLKRYDMTVLVPSLLVVTCWGGRTDGSSNSQENVSPIRSTQGSQAHLRHQPSQDGWQALTCLRCVCIQDKSLQIRRLEMRSILFISKVRSFCYVDTR